jgi:hypothetical protein
MTPHSPIFDVADCPLPALTLDSEVPGELSAELDRLQAGMSRIAAERAAVKSSLIMELAALMSAVDSAKIELLRGVRVRLMQTVQAELDLRGEFHAFLTRYAQKISELQGEAQQRADAATAEVTKAVLAGVGFDAGGQADANDSWALVRRHPKVRTALARVDQLTTIGASLNRDMTCPCRRNEDRVDDLKKTLAADLADYLRGAGLYGTVLYAYRSGCDCQPLINEPDL